MPRTKYVLLLPLTYNDGTRVPKEVRDHIEEEIFLLAGGFRYGSSGRGAYRMKNGEKQIDVTQEVWIAIDEADEAALKELVGRFGAMLGQESMYLEKTGGTVDFVLPLALGE